MINGENVTDSTKLFLIIELILLNPHLADTGGSILTHLTFQIIHVTYHLLDLLL